MVASKGREGCTLGGRGGEVDTGLSGNTAQAHLQPLTASEWAQWRRWGESGVALSIVLTSQPYT